MNTQTENASRSLENVLFDISEISRVFLDERRIYGEMRTDIKKRMARTRLYIVNGLGEFLKPEVAELLKNTPEKKLTLDTIESLIILELGDDYDRYEAAKFNAMTSEKAFPMFHAELTGLQSKIKKDAFDRDNLDFAQSQMCERCRQRKLCVQVKFADERQVISVTDETADVPYHTFLLCSECSFQCSANPDERYILINRRRK